MPAFPRLSCWLLPSCRRSKEGILAARSSSTLSGASAGSAASGSGLPGGQKVCIDADTEVPFELYLDLVESGKRARARGQHHKVRPRSGSQAAASRQPLRRPTRLVSSEAGQA